MTKIEWTKAPGFNGESWNPVVGCQRTSPGCENCYAETLAHRLELMGQENYKGLTVARNGGHRWAGFVRRVPEALAKPLRWRKPRMVFVCSMSDLFHHGVPFEYIAAIFGVMAACPHHRFLVLTKRADRMREWFEWMGTQHTGCLFGSAASYGVEVGPLNGIRWPLPNVWLGTTVEDQGRADERIPDLLSCPAAVHYISAEPLLGPLRLTSLPANLRSHGPEAWDWFDALTGIGEGPNDAYSEHETYPKLDWVIVGGESGHGARRCDAPSVRSIVGQCRAHEVPVFVKQLGARWVDERNGVSGAAGKPDESVVGKIRKLKHRKGADPSEWPEDLRIRQWPERLGSDG